MGAKVGTGHAALSTLRSAVDEVRSARSRIRAGIAARPAPPRFPAITSSGRGFLDARAVPPEDRGGMSRTSSVLAWMLPLGLLIGSIVFVPLLVLDERGLPRYHALRDELQEIARNNDRLREEVRRLQHEVRALRSDERAIERIARDELGMVRADEIIFQFPE
jgi:cell division protein FtsB